MTRTDNDTWDLTTSVGATATGVAVGRALASRAANPLINDPFAEPLVRAVGVDFFTRLASGELNPAEVDDNGEWGMQRMRDMMAVRTRFFDDFFIEATNRGIRQAVILASGLDARAYRLHWPAGTTVYEIDQPQVVEYKTATLNAAGAAPKATRKTVPVDLRDDWPAALSAAGFDRTQPTGWLAEGLLPYLPAEAQDRLFEMLTELSAPGSQVAVEAFSLGSGDPARRRAARRIRFERMRERLGLEINVETLTYQENDRADAAEWLTAHGWRVRAVSNADEMARLGRPIPTDLAEEAFTTRLLRAELGAAD